MEEKGRGPGAEKQPGKRRRKNGVLPTLLSQGSKFLYRNFTSRKKTKNLNSSNSSKSSSKQKKSNGASKAHSTPPTNSPPESIVSSAAYTKGSLEGTPTTSTTASAAYPASVLTVHAVRGIGAAAVASELEVKTIISISPTDFICRMRDAANPPHPDLFKRCPDPAVLMRAREQTELSGRGFGVMVTGCEEVIVGLTSRSIIQLEVVLSSASQSFLHFEESPPTLAEPFASIPKPSGDSPSSAPDFQRTQHHGTVSRFTPARHATTRSLPHQRYALSSMRNPMLSHPCIGNSFQAPQVGLTSRRGHRTIGFVQIRGADLMSQFGGLRLYHTWFPLEKGSPNRKAQYSPPLSPLQSIEVDEGEQRQNSAIYTGKENYTREGSCNSLTITGRSTNSMSPTALSDTSSRNLGVPKEMKSGREATSRVSPSRPICGSKVENIALTCAKWVASDPTAVPLASARSRDLGQSLSSADREDSDDDECSVTDGGSPGQNNCLRPMICLSIAPAPEWTAGNLYQADASDELRIRAWPALLYSHTLHLHLCQDQHLELEALVGPRALRSPHFETASEKGWSQQQKPRLDCVDMEGLESPKIPSICFSLSDTPPTSDNSSGFDQFNPNKNIF